MGNGQREPEWITHKVGQRCRRNSKGRVHAVEKTAYALHVCVCAHSHVSRGAEGGHYDSVRRAVCLQHGCS